jgi:hypothetical protein
MELDMSCILNKANEYKINILMRISGGVLALFTILIGLIQFSESVDNDYKMSFVKEQVQFCKKAVSLTALIATAEDGGSFPGELVDRLAELHFGEALLFLDEKSMWVFRENFIAASRCNRAVNGEKDKQCYAPYTSKRAYDFAVSCRDMFVNNAQVAYAELDSDALESN